MPFFFLQITGKKNKTTDVYCCLVSVCFQEILSIANSHLKYLYLTIEKPTLRLQGGVNLLDGIMGVPPLPSPPSPLLTTSITSHLFNHCLGQM